MRIWKRWLAGILGLGMVAPFPSSAAVSCQDLFRPELVFEPDTEIWRENGRPVQFERITKTDSEEVEAGYRYSAISDRDLFPSQDRSKRVVVGFLSGHTYFFYKGYRIDSRGSAGYKVTSQIRKSEMLYGDLLVVIPDLPEATLQKLDRLVENFKARSRISCTKLTCTSLSQAEVLDFPRRFTRSSSFLNFLVERSQVADGKIRIVSLDGMGLRGRSSKLLRLESNLISSTLITAFAGAGIVGSFVEAIALVLEELD